MKNTFTKFRLFWDNISNAGVEESMPFVIQKQIRFMNQLMYFLIPVLIASLIAVINFKSISLIVSLSFLLIYAFFTPTINRKGYQNVNRAVLANVFLIFIIIPLCISGQTVLRNYISFSYVSFFMLLLSQVLFNYRYELKLYLLFVVISFLVIYYNDVLLMYFDHDTSDLSAYLEVRKYIKLAQIFLFIFITSTIFFFHKNSNDIEDMLNAQKSKIDEKVKEISSINHQLTAKNEVVEEQNSELKAVEEELRQNIEELVSTQEALATKDAENNSITSALYKDYFVIEYDLDGTINWFNKKVEEGFGFSLNELKGKKREEYLVSSKKEDGQFEFQPSSIWSKLKEGNSLVRINEFSFPNGIKIHFKSTYAPLKDKNGTTYKILSVAQNISKVIEYQAEIERKSRMVSLNNSVLLRLSKSLNRFKSDFNVSIRELLSESARHMNVSQISVWGFTPDNKTIKCIEMYRLGTNDFISGFVIEEENYPEYFEAIMQEKVINADHARENPVTSCFNKDYFPDNDIFSLLDIPIFYEGKLWGVICLEQKKYPRVWTVEEMSFAKSIADLLLLAIESLETKNNVDKLKTIKKETIAKELILKQQMVLLNKQKDNIEQKLATVDSQNKLFESKMNYIKKIQDSFKSLELKGEKSFKFLTIETCNDQAGDSYLTAVVEKEDKVYFAIIASDGDMYDNILYNVMLNQVMNGILFNNGVKTLSYHYKQIIMMFEAKVDIFDTQSITLCEIDATSGTLSIIGNELFVMSNNVIKQEENQWVYSLKELEELYLFNKKIESIGVQLSDIVKKDMPFNQKQNSLKKELKDRCSGMNTLFISIAFKQ